MQVKAPHFSLSLPVSVFGKYCCSQLNLSTASRVYKFPRKENKREFPKKEKEPESRRISVKRAETQTESMF